MHNIMILREYFENWLQRYELSKKFVFLEISIYIIECTSVIKVLKFRGGKQQQTTTTTTNINKNNL